MKKTILISFIIFIFSSHFAEAFAESNILAENLAEEMFRAEKNSKINRIPLNRFMLHPKDKDLNLKMKQMTILDASGYTCILIGIQDGLWGAPIDYNNAYLEKVIENGVTTWILKGVIGGAGHICRNNTVFKSNKDKQFVPIERHEEYKLKSDYAKHACVIKVGSDIRKLTDNEATEIAKCSSIPYVQSEESSDKNRLRDHMGKFMKKIEADPDYKNFDRPETALYCGKYILQDESKRQYLECTNSFIQMNSFGLIPGRVSNGFCYPRRSARDSTLCPINTQPKGFTHEDSTAFFTTGPGDCRNEFCTQIKAHPPIENRPATQSDAHSKPTAN